jgi:hypothetical protein
VFGEEKNLGLVVDADLQLSRIREGQSAHDGLPTSLCYINLTRLGLTQSTHTLMPPFLLPNVLSAGRALSGERNEKRLQIETSNRYLGS